MFEGRHLSGKETKVREVELHKVRLRHCQQQMEHQQLMPHTKEFTQEGERDWNVNLTTPTRFKHSHMNLLLTVLLYMFCAI